MKEHEEESIQRLKNDIIMLKKLSVTPSTPTTAANRGLTRSWTRPPAMDSTPKNRLQVDITSVAASEV